MMEVLIKKYTAFLKSDFPEDDKIHIALKGFLADVRELEDRERGKNNPLLQLMHDTMSPVNTIKGAVDLLKKGDLSEEEKNRLLNAIKERADKLNEVLDAYYVSQKKL